MAQRHASYFRGIAEAAEPELDGPDPARCVRKLIADQENLRAALAWTIDTGEAVTGSGPRRRSGGCGRSAGSSGRAAAGSTSSWPCLPPGARPRFMRGRSRRPAGSPTGRATRRHTYYQEALAIHRALDDPHGIADSLQNLAFTVMAADMDEGSRLFSESLARYRGAGRRAQRRQCPRRAGLGPDDDRPP